MKNQASQNAIIGEGTKVFPFVNLYRCTIGKNSKVGSFVEIQNDVEVGDRVKIQSHSFICEGVKIEDEAFIGHGVTFVNDKFPRSTNPDGSIKKSGDWVLQRTIVKKRASIGSGSTILSGIIIGEGAIVGAGSVVTHDVARDTIVVGNPAKFLRKVTSSDEEK